ncbi:class A sortase [Leuconostoc citreum]|uniref:class A sortase n=1 Tax=Leuconostoc citreum TaxID=33964 RepID=UPI0022E67C93|nr:class A sortase [Leuconostoc citreum]
MAINLEQIKRRQATAQPRQPNYHRPKKHHYILKTMLLVVPSILIFLGAAVYGNHSQWQTAAQLEKTIRQQAQSKKSHNSVGNTPVFAVTIAKASQERNVTPDYSGQGGLTSKENMLKLAASTQPEILRGHVAMPSYQISEPVYEGTSNHVLAIGVGINQPNQVFGQGNLSIYGHNMGDYNALWPYKPTKFSALQNMSAKHVINQPIYLSDGQTVYEYHVTKLNYGVPVKTYEANLAQETPSKPTINLVACLEDDTFWQQVKRSGYTNFKADKRIVVTGQLVDQKPMRDMTETIKQQLQ